MTPQQKIKWAILLIAAKWDGEPAPEVAAENVDDLYGALVGAGGHWDAKDQIRCSGIETGLEAPFSRHYEGEAVASKMPDGSWVGWTYWHGGGKHGEPEAIDWMNDAYAVNCTEEEKMVKVQTFTKAD